MERIELIKEINDCDVTSLLHISVDDKLRYIKKDKLAFVKFVYVNLS